MTRRNFSTVENILLLIVLTNTLYGIFVTPESIIWPIINVIGFLVILGMNVFKGKIINAKAH